MLIVLCTHFSTAMWSNSSHFFPKQTAVKSQSCCSPLNTAAQTQKSQGGWSPCSAEWGITVSQRPLGAPLLGPSAGNSPVAKNNSQTDDRLNLGGDHTVNVLFFFFFKLSLQWPKYRPPCLSELPPVCQTLGRLTALKPSEIQDNTSPSSNVNVGSLLSPYLKFKANI